MEEEPVQSAIWQALAHFDFEDAIFLSERLHAEVKDEDTLYLLAVSYYRARRLQAAHRLLKSASSPKCRYLLAKCCLDLDDYAAAEQALTGTVFYSGSDTLDKVCTTFGESASYALALLGHIYRYTKRIEKASEVYNRALKLNPFLWSLFEALVAAGEKPNPLKVFAASNAATFVSPKKLNSSSFAPSPAAVSQAPIVTTPQIMQTPVSQINVAPSVRGASSTASRNNSYTLHASSLRSGPVARSVFGGINALTPPSPSFGVIPLSATPANPGFPGSNLPAFETPTIPITPAAAPPPQAPQRKPKKNQLSNLFFGGSTAASPTGASSPVDSTAVVRRSSRLYATTGNAVKENAKSASTSSSLVGASPTRLSRLGGTVSNRTNTKKKSSKSSSSSNGSSTTTKTESELNEINKEVTTTMQNAAMATAMAQNASVEGLMQLLQRLGMAKLELAQYQCQRCIDYLNTLPAHQFNTPWVLSTLGKAYFEMAKYTQSVHYFKQLRRQFPCVLDGLEYYSSALWHLQQEVELSTLSQQLVDLDEFAPETLCALGNFFSLQKMHEVAIEHLERATELHPNFTYAFTLLGHELLQAEELEKALTCFRKAMLIDPRHYNAWYGIGMVYYRQEQFELAEFHLKKAIDINANNSVLLCHIGVVQHAQKKPEALATFNSAMQMNSKNALVKFHRASVLYAQDKLQEALEDLNELKQLSPNESLVYFMLGKVHKKLGNEHLALMNLSCATDMDPRGAYTQIKESIDPTSRCVTTEEHTTPAEDPVPTLMDSDDSF